MRQPVTENSALGETKILFKEGSMSQREEESLRGLIASSIVGPSLQIQMRQYTFSGLHLIWF